MIFGNMMKRICWANFDVKIECEFVNGNIVEKLWGLREKLGLMWEKWRKTVDLVKLWIRKRYYVENIWEKSWFFPTICPHFLCPAKRNQCRSFKASTTAVEEKFELLFCHDEFVISSRTIRVAGCWSPHRISRANFDPSQWVDIVDSRAVLGCWFSTYQPWPSHLHPFSFNIRGHKNISNLWGQSLELPVWNLWLLKFIS